MRFIVKKIELNDKPIAILNYRDALQYGIPQSRRIRVLNNSRVVYAEVLVSKTIVNQGYIGLNEPALNSLRVREGDTVIVKIPPNPRSIHVIHKRLHGERLSEDEIRTVVEDVVSGAIGEAEIAAFLSSQIPIPLSNEELTELIKAMAYASEVVEFDEPVYDEHSIGGVPGNSKVALLAVPTVASTGTLIPKTSSRAITSPAGTADTMEVLAPVDLSPEEIKKMAKKVRGTLVWGGGLNIAIADDIFIEVERKIMIDPLSQMIASILSKKLAMSVNNLVIDIPVGKGAKVQDYATADKIAGLFINQCGRLGITVRVALTFGGEPIGRTVGPALEAREALKTLIEGKGSHSLVDKAVNIAGLVLELAGKADRGQGEKLARELLVKGRSYSKMKEIIEAQGGNPNIKPDDIPVGDKTYTITSPLEGAVTHIDNVAISLITRAAGAPFDKGAGIYFHVKLGYRVRKGDPLFTIHASTEKKLDDALKLVEQYKPIMIEGMLIKALP